MYKIGRVSIGLILILCSYGILYAKGTDTTIIGTVIISGENEIGEVSAIAIEIAEDENDERYAYYNIVLDATGKKLIYEVGSTVSVTGGINQDKKGKLWIKVKKWKVLQKNEEDDTQEQEPEKPYEQDLEETLGDSKE